MKRNLSLIAIAAFALVLGRPEEAHGTDLTGGVMYAVPTPGGKAPVINGDLSDWDLSGIEPSWQTAQTARTVNASFAIMYDDDALYFAAKVAQPRPIRNPNNPTDAFWNGDIVELRLVADTNAGYPIDAKVDDDKAGNRVAHCSFWKNSETDKDYIQITYGLNLNKGKVSNPPGAQISITDSHKDGYILESRIPWSAFNVAGGKNPFRPGQRMTATISPHFGGESQWPVLFRVNPGMFAFHNPDKWGQVEFSATGNLKPRHGTMEDALAAEASKPLGVPIVLNVPDDNLKVSVNIFGPNGEVVRDLIGDEPHSKGDLTVYWDGKDQWGAPVSPGAYKWGAYMSPGLKIEYMGTAGTSGHPGYESEDGHGLWGSDHAPAIGVAADSTGLYFLWVLAESGRALVKTDYDGNVLWRVTPFTSGGFGPFYSLAANGKYVFIAHESDDWQHLVRIDATTGHLLTFPGNVSLAFIAKGKLIKMPPETTPVLTGHQTPPQTAGMAANDHEVFMPHYGADAIHVVDPETGRILRDIPCPSPRGLSLDAKGDLYVISFPVEGKPQVLKFIGAKGDPTPVITTNLVAPWDIAVDSQGNMHVTDLGTSQQVKVFSPDGNLVRTMGKPGGRLWAGAYDKSSFLLPAGIAADAKGGILVAEAAIPKVMSRFDATSGKLLQRWYGAIAYTGLGVPDPKDPMTLYYPITPENAWARAHIPAPQGVGEPDAYWDMAKAGYRDVDLGTDRHDAMTAGPAIAMLDNGKKYFVTDVMQHGICLIDGDNFIPVGHVGNGVTGFEIWSDLNGDGKLEPNEVSVLKKIGDKPTPRMSGGPGSCWLDHNGDAYVTANNSIIKIPAKGIDAHGVITWDADKASYAVPLALDKPVSSTDPRHPGTTAQAGALMLGTRPDSQGNIYTCFNTSAQYATPELTASMKEGLSHTAEFTAVKFAKYAPDGHLLWMAGRKATTAAKPGEMYHFWALSGLVGDKYLAGGSEWGQIYFYTHDGFFVDALMNNPGLMPAAGPYTFGSETFGDRVQEFPERNEVWAYSCGMAFKVSGFDHGRVIGEQRLSGNVQLDHVYEAATTAVVKAAPMQIVPFNGAWDTVPISKIDDLATIQLAYDENSLHARFHVKDASPLKNGADSLNVIFHGGDAVGLDFGPAQRDGEKNLLGDVRILAAMVNGKPTLVAMKPMTALQKQPDHYSTPAGGTAQFDFVGEIPGGNVTLTPDTDGYTALLTIPRKFIEVPLTGMLAADAEVMFSGQAARGLQTVDRHYLFSPLNSKTTMIDDVPTEARLYPQWWGTAEIK